MSILLKLAMTGALLWFAMLPVAVWLIWYQDGRYDKAFARIWFGLLYAVGILLSCALLMGLWCL